MNEENSTPNRGLADPSQDSIEKRAARMASMRGHSSPTAEDLQDAEKEILGTSSPGSSELPTPTESDDSGTPDNPSGGKTTNVTATDPDDRRVEESESDGGRTK